MELQAEPIRDGIAVRVQASRIDAAGAEGRVVLDLGTVTFIDSSGLGAIVAAMKQLGPARRLELAGMLPMVEKVFRLTRMDSVFRIHPTLAAADGAMRQAS